MNIDFQNVGFDSIYPLICHRDILILSMLQFPLSQEGSFAQFTHWKLKHMRTKSSSIDPEIAEDVFKRLYSSKIVGCCGLTQSCRDPVKRGQPRLFPLRTWSILRRVESIKISAHSLFFSDVKPHLFRSQSLLSKRPVLLSRSGEILWYSGQYLARDLKYNPPRFCSQETRSFQENGLLFPRKMFREGEV